MGVIVIAVYTPKPGSEAALADHVPHLRRLDLVTEREPILMKARDGSFVEVFEWRSQNAIDRAHQMPEVGDLWARFAAVCDYRPIGALPEASELFSPFSPA